MEASGAALADVADTVHQRLGLKAARAAGLLHSYGRHGRHGRLGASHAPPVKGGMGSDSRRVPVVE